MGGWVLKMEVKIPSVHSRAGSTQARDDQNQPCAKIHSCIVLTCIFPSLTVSNFHKRPGRQIRDRLTRYLFRPYSLWKWEHHHWGAKPRGKIATTVAINMKVRSWGHFQNFLSEDKEENCSGITDVHQQDFFFPLRWEYISGFNFNIKTIMHSSPGIHLAFASACQIPPTCSPPPCISHIIPGVIGNDINMEVNIHMLSICHPSPLHLGSIYEQQ